MCLDGHGLGFALPHYCPADAELDRVRATAQEGPSERRGDDWRILDSSNAELRSCLVDGLDLLLSNVGMLSLDVWDYPFCCS